VRVGGGSLSRLTLSKFCPIVLVVCNAARDTNCVFKGHTIFSEYVLNFVYEHDVGDNVSISLIIIIIIIIIIMKTKQVKRPRN
jgi:hypothetical protein